VHELERIVREALRNVRRHSEASSVRVAVGQFDDQLTLTVEDDGRGLPTELPPGSYGLVGMRERAELLGGELEVVSRPQGGAVVRGRFALARLQEGVRGE
ncbi:MAG TPA: ATP-binding protein, partial [Deinococcales bacterium]|nr:ATP-binding protein [Deinococcales bacterium]